MSYKIFFKKLKDVIFSKMPFLRRWIFPIAIFMYRLLWKIKFNLKSKKLGFDIDKILFVNPEKIEYISQVKGSSSKKLWSSRGCIANGLGHLEKRFEDLDIYQAFKNRFLYNNKWEDTGFYRRVIGEINEGKEKWGCKDKESFDKRLKDLESLYEKIRNTGYRIKNDVHSDFNSILDDEVCVDIDRYGDILFREGRHRLCIAKLLKLPRIPVKVILRHTQWFGLRRELLSYANELGGKLYQPLTHPDLTDIPTNYDDYRFKTIRDNLTIREQGTILDIGANMGYFCSRFEDEGFNCYAVESDIKSSYFLNKLRRAENKKFEIVTACSIFDYRKGEILDFDVVLALNIFHHFLKNESAYYKLIELLKRIKTREIFFEPHNYNEKQMIGAYKNYHPEEFVDFILKHTSMGRVEVIGKDPLGGRFIFKITS